MKATKSRCIWRACLCLWIAVYTNAGLPQTPAKLSAQIRDHFQRAQTALQAKDTTSAEREFRAILDLDPKNVLALTRMGEIAFLRNDFQNASRYLRSALVVQPSLTKAQALLGISLRRLGDPSARALLEKSFPKLQEKPLRLQVGMELAGIYDREGTLDRAASVMQALVDIDPDSVNVLFLAQRMYSELADNTMNKLAVLAPGSARMQQVIAEKLVNAGDLMAAIEHYKKALEIDLRLPGVRYELGEAILESSPTDPATQAQALKEFEAAIQTEGDNAKIECQFARIAHLRSDMDQAYAHYDRAFALNPAEVDAQMGLARLLVGLDKPQGALKFLHMAVQQDPLNAEAHYRLSVVCRKLDLKAEAEKELRLFQDIKKTKERVRELYRQMNKRLRAEDEEVPEGGQ